MMTDQEYADLAAARLAELVQLAQILAPFTRSDEVPAETAKRIVTACQDRTRDWIGLANALRDEAERLPAGTPARAQLWTRSVERASCAEELLKALYSQKG